VPKLNSKEYSLYASFLNKLAIELTKFYYSKLNRTFKVSNKLKGKGYDPVTSSDKTFEKFIRNSINKKFPSHEIIGEEFGYKKTKSDFTWVIDPIDGTRSYVIGNPTWSNLISLNYKGIPVIGLANFPILRKYYLNYSKKIAYVVENGKKRKLSINKKALYKNVKVSAAFHGWLSLDKQKKIPKVLKLMQFPCSDALSYCHLAEGKVDVVIQCSNKIWDIHPIMPIIEASGGNISTWDNKNAIKAGNILVTANNVIHKKFLKLLKPVSK
jgi:histidinol phosphatase-like enzyme (inositol monophosphatase family)